uniref:Gag-pol polyprotein n=1 Tax=Oryza sativa subsp. japonica TaxID=39947 RepID=Q94H26_ORYSJ|nr:putative gag-pol polyprotein [Oryza sativa Japonica Group]
MAEKPPPSPSSASPGSVKEKIQKLGLLDVNEGNIMTIDPEKFTPDQKKDFEEMMQQARDQFLNSFMQTRKGTLVQKYKIKVVADDPGTSSSKDEEGKQAPDGLAQPSDKGATYGFPANQGDNSQGGVQGGGVNQDDNAAQLQFNNFQDQVDYAVHHALINQSGILTNTLANMVKSMVDGSMAEYQATGPVYLPGGVFPNYRPIITDNQPVVQLIPLNAPSAQPTAPVSAHAPAPTLSAPGQVINPRLLQSQGTPQQRPWADLIADVMKEQFGLRLKDAGNLYRQPYPEWFERVPLPNRFKVPDFSKFLGQDSISTYKHISRFLAQCGEASAVDALKVRLFRLSLYGSAFTWFSSLPYGSINSWADLEKQFHSYFYSGVHEMKLSDLTSIKQRHDEPVHEYIQRFREMRNKCYSLSLTDAQLADLAFQGMIAPIREKFSSEDFESLSHLTQKVTLHEQRFAEARKNSRKVNHVCPYMYGSDDDSEIAAAEWVRSKKVIPCQWVKNSGKEERYDFDITKADKIFDLLLREKQIQLPAGHAFPTAEELGKKRYCKWHNSGSQTTNDCKVFRQQIQAAIEGCKIKFDDSKRPRRLMAILFLLICIKGSMTSSRRSIMKKMMMALILIGVVSSLDFVGMKKTKPRQEWRVKNQVLIADEATADEAKRLAKGKRVVTASVNMVFTLPAEFGIKQADIDEVEEESAKLILSPEQAVFEMPEGTENRHLKPLYINGYVNEKPMSKMMVDGRAAVNLMPYTTFRKLGRNAEDLIKTNMVLKDFGSNPSETKGVLNVELTVGNKTIPTMFFVIDGKGSYSLLRGRDWIHANCCIPSTMHQCLIQWQGDKIEIVPADRTKLIELLKEFRDCFAWEYYEMPGLSRSIVEHRLPIKLGVRPHQQPPRRCKADILEPVKAEIKRLYNVGFIRPCRYAEWVSSIVPVIKKNGKVRVCIDFRNLNKATPKDEYPMPFLGFLVHERGIEVTQRSVNAIKKIQPPENKTELQEMIGKINFVRRFISNLSGRLMHYLLSNECTVICKVDVVKYMLSAPILKRRVGKWIFSLTEFDLRYDSPKAIKGQAIADFIVKHRDDSIDSVEVVPWTLFFDGSVCTHGCGIGLVIISPRGACFEFAYTIKPNATNNQDEYEAVLKGLQLLKEVEADAIEIMEDSLLVISQLVGEYECKNDALMVYNEKCQELMKEFRLVTLKHVSREQNIEANDLAQGASGYKPMIKDVKVEIAAMTADDWRYDVHQYLQNPSQSASRKLRYKALKYTLLDDELYYRTIDGVLLKSLSADQAKVAIGEVHEGICGTHQSAYEMKWLLRRAVFVSDEFVQFADSMGIKLLNSSPYYAQANGQAEASNKSLIKLIKRKISDYPRQWHTRLAEALWSYRMACHGSIQVPPYKLVYGHEAVLPWEIRIGSRRTELQNDLMADEYYNLMADEREDLVQSRLRALAKVTKDKERVARHYNKKVVPKDLSEGELVWKLILPIGTRDSKFGKWSPNWEGPFQIYKVVSKGAYMLQGLDGDVFGRALNDKYLKIYYPSVWVNA